VNKMITPLRFYDCSRENYFGFIRMSLKIYSAVKIFSHSFERLTFI
jgi:hypothetical protein